MRTKTVNEEVLYTDERLVTVGSRDIDMLKDLAMRNRRKRIRLCAHRDVTDKVHEMLIVHTKDAYVRPHKHLTKSESFHIIEGVADVVIFAEEGTATDVVRMGDHSSPWIFYYRISEPLYHTLLIRSDFLVFHETATGPFIRSDSVNAPWSPDDADTGTVEEYMASLARSIDELHQRRANGDSEAQELGR